MDRNRPLWLALMVVASVVVAGAAGLLTAATGVHPAVAVLGGGAAFSGTLGLMIGVAHFATASKS